MIASGSARGLAALSLLLLACAPARPALELRHVVLYQNGIGYFEHTGQAQGSSIELSFRQHELGDVLKTLTVVQAGTSDGAAVAVTALAPRAASAAAGRGEDADRVALSIALRGDTEELLVAYAVPTPTWSASYRLVLPEPGRREALLQGWAAIHNTSETDWRAVKLTLATGAPLSFAIDLHTPRYVARPDLTGKLVEPVARGAITAERALPGDRDGDGVKDADDLCPDHAEDRDGFQDADGCPDPDNDGDGIPDVDDLCPNEPETYNGIEDEDGCPDRGRVVVTDTSIEILDRIYFKRNQADLMPQSQPIVEAIAATLMGNEDIVELEVQGHASNDEADAWNLTRRRAASVRRALVALGVTTRLLVRPYAATMPIRPGSNEEARAVNRRAEFLITKRRDESGGGGPAAGTVSAAGLARSVQAAATPRDVAGSVRYELDAPVSIARGASALVPILNQSVAGEDVYLFRPDASAPASELHPWRAARLENRAMVTLEPGPVAIFARGAFVGEGLIERLHPGENTFIPYALDSATVVRGHEESSEEPVALVAIARGVATVESRLVRVTRYEVRAGQSAPSRIFLRHPRTPGYAAAELPPQTEETPTAYLVPMPLVASRQSVIEVKETRPVQRTVHILDGDASEAGVLLSGGHVPPEILETFVEILQLRASAAALEEETDLLRDRLADVGERADEVRESLKSIRQDGRAAALRARLLRSLSEATEESERIARELATKSATHAEARARLNEAVRALVYERAAAGQ